ncbi:MAG: hypothetical protein JSS81_01415 [Acidobacteria bacterium]|nr:hypothetical protein [Acidobacteriota bacterium]
MMNAKVKTIAALLFVMLAAAAELPAQTAKVYAWVRIYTATRAANSSAVTESAFYTSIGAINAADTEKARQNAVSYFNAKIVPYFSEDLKLTVKDVQIKTFPSLAEADDARYAVFQNDKKTLNPKADDDYWSTFFFNCSLADGGPRASWMAGVAEVHVAGVPVWKYFKIEVASYRKADGEESPGVDQRFYFSEPFEVYVTGSDSRRMPDIFSKYFESTVEQPLIRKHGYGLRWSADQKEILPGYVRNDTGNTYREAKADLDELIENRKGYEMPMLMFEFSDRGTDNGEDTSRPRCFANCELAKAPLTASQASAPVKPSNSPKKKN